MVEKNLLTTRIFEGIEKSGGCPLCYLWLKSEERHMIFLLKNETVTGSEVRKEVLTAKGFCNRHAHLLYRTAYKSGTEDGLGYAIYMKDIVGSISEQVEPLTKQLRSLKEAKKDFLRQKKRKRDFSLLADAAMHVMLRQQQCPSCRYLQSLDIMHQHTLLQMLEDKNFQKNFESSKGLCLPHFVSTIRMLDQNKFKDPVNIAWTLLKTENERLQLVEHYLSEFIRKKSWDFRGELLEPEANANHTALNLLVSVEGIRLSDK